MSAGDLRDVVTVQSRTTTTDSQGGRSASWSTFATIRAAVRAGSAGESKENERVTSVTGYEVETRYRSDITTVMRLSWTPYSGSAKSLQIVGVRVKPGRPDYMLIDCEEAA